MSNPTFSPHIHTLLAALAQHKQKPYLPIWGELFCTLRDIRKIAQHQMQSAFLYSIEPKGRMVYDFRKDAFTAEIDELNISITLTLHELIDALIAGRFLPREDVASAIPVDQDGLIAKTVSASYNK